MTLLCGPKMIEAETATELEQCKLLIDKSQEDIITVISGNVRGTVKRTDTYGIWAVVNRALHP